MSQREDWAGGRGARAGGHAWQTQRHLTATNADGATALA
jgi:hypothetical protein